VAVFLKERALRNEIEFHGHSVSPRARAVLAARRNIHFAADSNTGPAQGSRDAEVWK
jgi:hypothetical protein